MGIEHICVLGLGYIGLPTATILAESGARVTGVDINPKAVEAVRAGRIHIVEPGLEALVNRVVASGRLQAFGEPCEADAFIITVPTPLRAENIPDMGYVKQAVADIAPLLKRGNLVVLESTSPVGTTEAVAAHLAALRPDLKIPLTGNRDCDIALAYCPERVMPGKTMEELRTNSRIIGGITPACAERARELYRRITPASISLTSARAAEMVKLTENAFRDVNIAFANELSLICDALGLSVWEVIALANHHPRVDILKPGPGVGGHCIAVDPWFIVHSAPQQARLIAQARKVNEHKRDYVIGQAMGALTALSSVLGRAPVVACLGLSFKPNVDDLRESPAVQIAQAVAQATEVLAVEPHISALPEGLEKAGVKLATLAEGAAQADLIIALVAHDAFKGLSPDAFAGKTLLDPCGLFSS